MAGIGDLFKSGSIGEQLLIWGVLNQVISSAIAPGVTEISNLVNEGAPLVPLSPAQQADMVARALKAVGDAESEAAKTGISSSRFAQLVESAGHAPSMGELVALLQRGLIGVGGADGSAISFYGGLADSGIRTQWMPLVEQLAIQIPSVAEVMNAWLEGQIDEGEANDRYLKAGGDPTWFQTSYNANGQAPTPVQALDMWNRGLIPEGGTGPSAVSYEQAFLEGPWRNKWLTAFKGLRIYYPPPRTVTAMYHDGEMTHDVALDYLLKQGLTPDLAAMYLSSGSSTKTAKEKDLSKTDILALYQNSLIAAAVAIPMLEAVGYDSTESGYLLKLQDVRKAAGALTAATTRVRSQFVAGKINEQAAASALAALGVPADQSGPLIAAWTIEHAASAPQLTSAQIGQAFNYAIFTYDQAYQKLTILGYDAHDAWVFLSIHNKGALPNEPAI